MLPPSPAARPDEASQPTPPVWQQQKRIPCLDGLRAAAILFVIFAHSTYFMHSAFTACLESYVHFGHMGVTFFFVLSGFLITWLLLREHANTGTVSLRAFYRRRILRIFPAYYLFLLVMALLAAFRNIPVNAENWLAALTYTMCFLPGSHRAQYVSHLWSLAVEEQFYLLWPLLILACKPRKAIVIALIYISVTPLLRYLISKYLARYLDYEITSLTQMSSIAIGCVLAYICTAQAPPTLRRLFERRAPAVALAGLVGIVASKWLGNRLWQFHVLFDDVLVASSFGLLMVGLVYGADHFAARLLNWKPLATLGLLSYSLYLWQQPFTNPNINNWPFNLLEALAVAVVSYLFVERPFLRWKDRLSAKTISATSFEEGQLQNDF